MRRVRARWLAAAVLLLAVVSVGVQWRRRTEAQPVRFRTAVVRRGTVVETVEGASGIIAPLASVDVRSRATGVVQAVYVHEGDRVAKGQVLARIDDPDAAAAAAGARAGWVAAQAQLRQAQANLAAAEARLQQTLAGNRPEVIAQAEQSVASAQATLDLATRTRDRNRQLFAEGFIARQDLDQAEAGVRSAQAAYAGALDNLRLLRAGPTADDVAAAQAAVRAARAQADAAAAQMAQAKATLASADERLSESTVRAPVSGLVAVRAVEVGQTLIGGTATSGTAIMTLSVDQSLEADVMVDEVDIARVHPGQAVALQPDSLPGRTFHGRVLAVSPNAQTVNNVVQYKVTVSVQGPHDGLKLGMSVDATFIVLQRTDVLVVPRDAVHRADGRATVDVLVGGMPQPRRVTTGAADSTQVEIRSGVREGELVVLGPARQAAPGPLPRNPFAPNFGPRR